MKTQDALDYLKEIMPENVNWPIDELCDLIIWAYDKGWEEGISDHEENGAFEWGL